MHPRQNIPAQGFGTRLAALFGRTRQAAEHHSSERDRFAAEIEQTLARFAEQQQAMADELAARPSAEEFAQLKADHEALAKRFTWLCEVLDNTPDTPQRDATAGAARTTY